MKSCLPVSHHYPRAMQALGIHLVQDRRRDQAPGRSAVAAIGPDGALLGVHMCATDDQIRSAIGSDPALILVDAPLVVPTVRGQRDAEHVLAWLDIPAFPVSGPRMETVYGGARGIDLVTLLAGLGHVMAEALPDQVLRQLMWETDHPLGSTPLGLATYRAAWLAVRPPAFRPRGGRAKHDGLAPARAILADAADLTAWPVARREGDLAALDEAAAIDAVALAMLAHRCLEGPGDSWALIGAAARGRVILAAGPDLIDRAGVNITRLTDEGSISIPREVAGTDVGPPQSW